MKKFTKFLVLFLSFCLCCSSTAFAHQGATLDKNGGHKDRLGYYHYHHGYEAHLHINGVCPYAENLTTVIPKNGVLPGTNVTAPLKEIPNTMAMPQEIGISVFVNQVLLKGPFLLYNNTYYVPLYQLANQLPISVSDDPATHQIIVKSDNDGLKNLYMDDYVVFLPGNSSQKYYHKFDCDILHQEGITNYFASDFRLVDEISMKVTPCPYCMH